VSRRKRKNGEEVTSSTLIFLARLKKLPRNRAAPSGCSPTRTGKVKDVLKVEQEIARVAAKSSKWKLEQQNAGTSVKFRTIDLKLSEEYKRSSDTPAPSVAMSFATRPSMASAPPSRVSWPSSCFSPNPRPTTVAMADDPVVPRLAPLAAVSALTCNELISLSSRCGNSQK